MLEGLLSIAVGVLLVVDPVQGEIGLTLLLALFLTIGGFMRIFLSLLWRSVGNWFWLLLSGIIEVLLGALIWTSLPTIAPWLIGLFIGIRMLFQGSSMLALGLALNALSRARADAANWPCNEGGASLYAPLVVTATPRPGAAGRTRGAIFKRTPTSAKLHLCAGFAGNRRCPPFGVEALRSPGSAVTGSAAPGSASRWSFCRTGGRMLASGPRGITVGSRQ